MYKLKTLKEALRVFSVLFQCFKLIKFTTMYLVILIIKIKDVFDDLII